MVVGSICMLRAVYMYSFMQQLGLHLGHEAFIYMYAVCISKQGESPYLKRPGRLLLQHFLNQGLLFSYESISGCCCFFQIPAMQHTWQ